MTEPAKPELPAPSLATAYHEAGHAVIALALGRLVQRVSILPNQLRLGACELKKGKAKQTHDPVETEILIFLGGVAAEARFTGTYAWGGAQQDLRYVRSLTTQRAGSQKQIERLERRMLDKVEHLLDDPAVWLATKLIADELLRSTTISGRAAKHLFEQAAAKFD
ncbi:ATP-dependent zinc metalloprotease FtsH [Anatilimnocola aggregata]|uniref:ATP-dependent zinc metalloprotease FtsH n=1 Tax=Anatilimnocola aggregata TaxID=2528021 RepID=A0A517Y4M0_9BACT|nr:cell division protein FtsH [Anatilimnocola aggregata]QDU25146.1 ATP-dependent zinc metalloprotease FtsH [Anatilimnocola aggregata]